jgi:hypothetical protein
MKLFSFGLDEFLYTNTINRDATLGQF